MDNSDRPRRLVSFIVVAKSLQMLEVRNLIRIYPLSDLHYASDRFSLWLLT